MNDIEKDTGKFSETENVGDDKNIDRGDLSNASVSQATPQQPVMAQPVMAQPVMAQPVMAQPVMAQPVMAQPVMAQPVSTQSVTAQEVNKDELLAEGKKLFEWLKSVSKSLFTFNTKKGITNIAIIIAFVIIFFSILSYFDSDPTNGTSTSKTNFSKNTSVQQLHGYWISIFDFDKSIIGIVTQGVPAGYGEFSVYFEGRKEIPLINFLFQIDDVAGNKITIHSIDTPEQARMQIIFSQNKITIFNFKDGTSQIFKRHPGGTSPPKGFANPDYTQKFRM